MQTFFIHSLEDTYVVIAAMILTFTSIFTFLQLLHLKMRLLWHFYATLIRFPVDQVELLIKYAPGSDLYMQRVNKYTACKCLDSQCANIII